MAIGGRSKRCTAKDVLRYIKQITREHESSFGLSISVARIQRFLSPVSERLYKLASVGYAAVSSLELSGLDQHDIRTASPCPIRNSTLDKPSEGSDWRR